MKKVLVGVLTFLLIFLVLIGGYLYKIIAAISEAEKQLGSNPSNWDNGSGDFGVPDDAPTEKETNAINILLLGTDRRNRNENGRSDSIIIATIDRKNGQLKLSSIMRDLYVPIQDRKDNRINAAYSFGGPRLAMQTINQNFNLNITRYVSVDFFGLEEIINSVGGVEMDIKEKEIRAINSVINELNKLDKKKRVSPRISRAGVQVLDGKQAVAYARIRKVGDGDSERTERQRRVIIQMFNKMKSVSPLKLPELVASLIPYTDTNIPPSEIISLGTSILRIGDKKIYQHRIPAKGTFQHRTIRGMAVIVPDMGANKELLHKFMFDKVVEETPN